MKRSSSWKNLQKTFASTPNTTKKRPKYTRSKVTKENVKQQKIGESIDIQIEDSDEENAPNDTTSVTATAAKTPVTPFQRIRRMPKPLLINTSLNSSTVNDSVPFACKSDSDESVCGEPELRDVSELCKSDERRCKARSKRLLLLAQHKKTPTHTENRTNCRITSSNVRSIPQQNQTNDTMTKTTTTDSIVGVSDDDAGTTIQSDSSSNEVDSPEKCSSKSSIKMHRTNAGTSNDIVFTQSASENSINPVIETQSSQFSLKIIGSPTIPLPRSKRPKCRKHIKGGLVEQLNKTISRTKSEYSFWMNERTNELIAAGRKMRIDKIQCCYGRMLLHCVEINAEIDPDTESETRKFVEIVCIGPTFKKTHELQVGKIIEIDSDCNAISVTNNSMFYPHVSKILV